MPFNTEILPEKIWDESKAIAFGSVRWYAIFIILGFIVAIVAACLKMWKRYKISTEPFYWFIIIGVPTAIIGANFGSCVLGEPAGKPWSEFFSSFGQGLAIEWGVLFTVIVACIYFPLVLRSAKYRVRDELGSTPQVRKVSMWMYFDAVMPCILIAQFLGRWGNYMNQEVYGAVVSSDGLIKFMSKVLPYMYIIKDHQWHQPLFLWEGLGNLVMFFVAYFGLEAINKRKTGDLFGFYLFWYGLFRLCLEPLRDSQYYSAKSTALSAVMLAIGLAIILINHLVISKVRDYKVWQALTAGHISSLLTVKINSYKQKRLETKINALVQANNLEKANTLKAKLNVVNDDLAKAKSTCQPHLRADNEVLYYGAW